MSKIEQKLTGLVCWLLHTHFKYTENINYVKVPEIIVISKTVLDIIIASVQINIFIYWK